MAVPSAIVRLPLRGCAHLFHARPDVQAGRGAVLAMWGILGRRCLPWPREAMRQAAAWLPAQRAQARARALGKGADPESGLGLATGAGGGRGPAASAAGLRQPPGGAWRHSGGGSTAAHALRPLHGAVRPGPRLGLAASVPVRGARRGGGRPHSGLCRPSAPQRTRTGATAPRRCDQCRDTAALSAGASTATTALRLQSPSTSHRPC